MGEDFEYVEVFALGAEAPPRYLHMWCHWSVPGKLRICRAEGEHHERVRSGWLSAIAVPMCWDVGRAAWGVLGVHRCVCSRWLPSKISALVWGSWCWVPGRDGWGVLGGFRRVAETSEMLERLFLFLFFFHPQKDGPYTERRVVGMVSHGMALGEQLLSRSVLPPLEGKTPGAGD